MLSLWAEWKKDTTLTLCRPKGVHNREFRFIHDSYRVIAWLYKTSVCWIYGYYRTAGNFRVVQFSQMIPLTVKIKSVK